MLSISACFVGLTLVAARAVAQNTAEECFADGYVNPCMGFAMDFHDGGSYFQNISSPDDFTFSSQFEGCQADAFANNLLVDPNGDQYLCTDTDIFPDDTTETSTCPLEKQQMWSGDWTVVIISNNGEKGCPIAIQRDFELTVAEPSTEVYTPTVTIPTVVTPVETSISVTTTTERLTLISTVTSPKYTLKPTTTITPKRVTSTKTATIGTIRKTAYTAIPVVKTKTLTKTCSLPHRATQKDKKATVTPTLVTAAALQITTIPEPTPKPRMRRAPLDPEGRLLEKQAFVAERRAWLEENGQLEKRGLDVATTTITESDHDDFNFDRSSNNNDHYLRSYYDEHTTNDHYALEREDDIIPSNRHCAYPDQNQNQIHFHHYDCRYEDAQSYFYDYGSDCAGCGFG
ncbi:hypothetical protein KC340_g7680 [Hortaea werneckii]|nr:hypothetical protein KC342_g7896 [Hortaea werneckii]KAI7106576.1 hypothetical protein KC339_g2993 [Hortaea werneckii]KAI7234852.1 hypothetical protein KC365_g5813 [Hortaea werneckii]KAI7320183.1 hypothetical protein KC340_g7680 [Hortaea werneckii]KAI7395023.1 hypothetical protein KC328_g5892 [Hortaea werneckii]